MALAVKSTMNNDHLKTLDAILKEPLSDVRMKLHQHMQGFTPAYKEMVKQKDPAKAQAISDQIQQAADQHFNEGHFNAYMDGLRKFAQDDLGGQNLAAFDREVAKAREAIETGDTTFDPNPSVRVNQLVWAVTLSYLTVNPKAQEKWADKNKASDITDTKVWNKVLESDTLEDELLDHAFHLSEEITNKDTKLRWGAPGSWFYNNREEPAINLDLIESLTLGLEHTRAAAYHEMGHNKLTVKLPQSMLDILGKLEAQDEKVEKGHKLTEDEYVERQKLAAEMQARHKIFNVCEDNTVNQYAVRQSVSLDYSVSINYTNVLLAGTGTLAQAVRQNGGEPVDLSQDPRSQHGTGDIVPGGADDVADAQKKFGNLQHAINMSFFQNNGLFADTEKGWKSVNVHTDWITEDPTYPGATGQTSQEALKHLQSLCRQLEELQPARNAKRFGEDAVRKMIPDMADKRIAIYEEIWERYAKQFAEPLIEKAEEQAKENADQQQGDGKDGDPSDQKGDKSDKSDQQKGDKSDKSDQSDKSDSDKSDKSDSSDKSDDQQNDKENDGQDAKDGQDKSDQKDQQKQDGKDKSDQQQDGQDNKDKSDDQPSDKENDGQDAKDGQDKSDQKDQQKQDGKDNKDKSDQQQDGDKSDQQQQDDQPSEKENDGQDAKDGDSKSDQKDQQKQDKSDQQKGDQGQQQDRDDDTVPVEDKGDLPDNASKENRPKDPVKEEEKRKQAEQEAKEKAEQEAKDKAEQDGQDSKDGNEKENDGQDAKDGEEKDGQDKGDQQDGDEKGDQKQEGEGQDAKDGEEKGEEQGEGQEGEGQEGEGQEGEGQDAKDGEGKDGKSKDGRTLDELNKEREKRQKDAAEKAAKEAAEKQKKKQQAEEGEGEGQGEGSGSGHSLADLKVGDWRNYDEMKREYAAPIREMSNILLKIREKKVIYQKERSREHSLKPEDGKLGRFDGEKYTNRIKKERTGQETTAEDYKTFRKDQLSAKPAPDDIVIAIDLSGSMASGGEARRGSRPVDIAIQIACIMREAGKKAETNVYILGWGEKGGGRWIATPDMDDKQIGDNIDGIKNAASWGTDFAPAVGKIADMYIEEKKGAHAMVGDTHIVVASDGDLFDEKQSNIIVGRMLKSCPNVTMDVAIINKDPNTNMGKMVQAQKAQRHHRQINVTNTTGVQETQDKMREVMTERLRVSAESEAIPHGEKQIRFKQAKRGAVMDGFGR